MAMLAVDSSNWSRSAVEGRDLPPKSVDLHGLSVEHSAEMDKKAVRRSALQPKWSGVEGEVANLESRMKTLLEVDAQL
ncbi:hypothetical protein ACGTRS_31775, partial [Burkholderia semiarida]